MNYKTYICMFIRGAAEPITDEEIVNGVAGGPRDTEGHRGKKRGRRGEE